MNALYIICGLGLTALLAEVFNVKRVLGGIILLGLATAIGFTITEWDSSISYFTNMVIFNNFALAFSTLIMVISIFWFWMAQDYFSQDLEHYSDRASLILFTIVGGILMVSFNNMAMLFWELKCYRYHCIHLPEAEETAYLRMKLLSNIS